MRALVTGSGGQLGKDVVATCLASGDDVLGLARSDLDVSDEGAVQRAIEEFRPETVINCAAWTAVDDCEGDPARADRINHLAVGYLTRACAVNDAHLVQVSTDYVFDGTKQGTYTEDDAPNPRSVYGASKLAGERAAGQTATVVRTSWVYSRHGGNMVATILRLADTHRELSFVADQRGNPSFTENLAAALRQLAADRHAGTLHITNTGTVSWFEFAQAVLAAAGHDPERVLPITTRDMPRPAPRPANSALSNDRYIALGHAPLPDFRETLAEVVASYA